MIINETQLENALKLLNSYKKVIKNINIKKDKRIYSGPLINSAFHNLLRRKFDNEVPNYYDLDVSINFESKKIEGLFYATSHHNGDPYDFRRESINFNSERLASFSKKILAMVTKSALEVKTINEENAKLKVLQDQLLEALETNNIPEAFKIHE